MVAEGLKRPWQCSDLPPASLKPPAPHLASCACKKHQGEHGGGTDLGDNPSEPGEQQHVRVLLFAGFLAQRGCCSGEPCSPRHPDTVGGEPQLRESDLALPESHSTGWCLCGKIGLRLRTLSPFSADSGSKATGSSCGSSRSWGGNLHPTLTVAWSAGEEWAHASCSAEVPPVQGGG